MVKSQADDPISFLQLFTKADQSVAENQFEISLLQAIGNTGVTKEIDATSSKLNKVLVKLLMFFLRFVSLSQLIFAIEQL